MTLLLRILTWFPRHGETLYEKDNHPRIDLGKRVLTLKTDFGDCYYLDSLVLTHLEPPYSFRYS